MEKRTARGALKGAVIQALKEYGRSVNVKSVWFRVQKSIPHTSQGSVNDCLLRLSAEGTAVRSGTAREAMWTYTNGIVAKSEEKPPVVEIKPIEVRPAVELLRPLCVGQYTINPNGWVCADDQNTRVELFTTALEIDSLTKHPRTKRLVFESANEMRLVRAWLAQQSGGLFSNADELEKERDAALELAEAAEARARVAEEKLNQMRAALGA